MILGLVYIENKRDEIRSIYDRGLRYSNSRETFTSSVSSSKLSGYFCNVVQVIRVGLIL